MKRPSGGPLDTRVPAVVSVPPFHGDTCSWRHTSFCCTGSQAISRPKGLLCGGAALANFAVFQPSPEAGWPGTLLLCVQFLSSIRLSGTFCAGRYTRPVFG